MATMDETRGGVVRRHDVGWWLTQGAICGFIAGIAFAIFEMIMAAILKNAFFGPMRMISGIVLGQQALTPSYSAATAIIVGFIVHFVLAIIFGAIFGLIAAYIPTLASSSMMLIVAASVYGLILWLVNFYLIAPAAGWVWFSMANPVVQFFVHTFFFGTVLGLCLDRVGARRRNL